MTQPEHTPTEQEDVLYDHMTAGEWDAIEELRADAYAADPTPPDPVPEDWLPPAEQFDTDYGYAYGHYQADHEAPEAAREVATKVEVSEENATAAEREEAI